MHRTAHLCLTGLLLYGALLLSGCKSDPQLLEQRILQFGTVIDVSIIHQDTEKIEQGFVEVEKRLQIYRQYWHAWEESDLYRFNQGLTQPRPVLIPASLRELIELSLDYYHTSQQLFNPALGKLIAAYGFHSSQQADEALIADIQQNLPTMLDLKISGTRASSDNPHLQLDFGGIAKGYAMSLIADSLKTSGFEHFLINAGGDVLVAGNRFGKPWRIGIQNPFKPGAIASINIAGDQHLFTSGNYQRYYQKEDAIVHHIIDPRSGRPSKHISSATVLTDDAVLADVAATTLMIDGWNNHRLLAKSLGIIDYLIINQNQEIIVSQSMAEKIEFIGGIAYRVVD